MVKHNDNEIQQGPRDEAEVAWDNFSSQLCGADMLLGGVGSQDLFCKMTLEEVYKHLYANHIKLLFTLNFVINLDELKTFG